MFSSFLVLVLAAVVPLAHANTYVTNPVASTTLPAGQQATIKWMDDGNSPSLAQLGPCFIGLYAGSVNEQALLQVISPSTDVSQSSSIPFTPQANVGPDFNAYFIKFTSIGLANPSEPGFNYEAFSAHFTLSDMTGTFNATVQAEINGSSIPVSAASTTPTAGASSTPVSVLASNANVSPNSASSTSAVVAGSSTPQSASSNGAGRIVVPGVLGATGVAAFAFAFFL